MQQTINIQELENALNKYGDIVLTKNSKNECYYNEYLGV